MKLTILTPTFNRKDLLPRLYDSLTKQTCLDFEWLVIDDGSTDGTSDLFDVWNGEADFPIIYQRKENGGKHTALNYAHPFIKGELILIVDSDDWIVENAVETILDDWTRYRDREEICGMTYLRGSSRDIVLGNHQFLFDGMISDFVTVKVNGKGNVDSCEVLRTTVFLEFPFPVFQGEKFIGESYLWFSAGYKYKTVYFNKILYITEYLEDGLTKAGRKFRYNCPGGGMTVAGLYNDSRVCLRKRIRRTWLFICYGKCLGLGYKQIIRESKSKIFTAINYSFGFLLYWYWKSKYHDTQNRL